ncbi:MAG: extracellular solute-binding protein [Anaerolineae bacterium]
MEQKSMSRRKLLKLMGLGAAATTLAACQPEVVEKVVTKEVEKVVKETVEVEIEKEVETEVTRVVGEEPVEISGEIIWDTFRGVGTGWNEERISTFEEQHPDMTVEFRPLAGASQQENYAKMYAMQAAGDLGDVIAFDPSHYHFWRAIESDIIAPLDEFASAEPDGFFDQWYEWFIEIQYYQGELYGLPSWGWSGPDCMVTNKYDFDQAGIELPEPTSHDTSMDQIAEWAHELYEEGGEHFGLGLGYGEGQIVVLCRAFNGFFLNEEGTECLILEDEGAQEAFRWIYDMAVEDQILPRPGELDFEPALTAGKLSMYNQGSLHVRNWRDIIEDQEIEDRAEAWQILYPEREDGRYPSQLRGGTWNVHQGTEYPQASWEFVKHLSNTEGILGFNLYGGNYSTVRPDVMDILVARDPIHEWFLDSLENGIPARAPANSRGREYTDAISQWITIMMDPEEGMEFEEGLDMVQEEIQAVLDMPMPS